MMKEQEELFEKFIPLVKVRDDDAFKRYMARSIFIHFLNQYNESVNLDSFLPMGDVIKGVNDLSNSNLKGLERVHELLNGLYEKYRKRNRKRNIVGFDLLDAYLNFIEYLSKQKYPKGAFRGFHVNRCFCIGINHALEGVDILDINGFWAAYREIPGIIGLIEFDWGLSTGEMAVMDIFAGFLKLKKREQLKDNLVVLLDEAETFLHPEWQRRFVDSLVFGFRNIFPQNNLQIVLSTHSPLILSDIPRQNAIYLCKEDGRIRVVDIEHDTETFGANIYDIYKDSYFLNGFMGKFAEKGINKIIDSIYNMYIVPDEKQTIQNEELECYSVAKKKIAIIGDRLIRNELQRMISKIERRNNDRDISK